MNITWTNCADEMPPDDETEIIIRHVEDKEPILTPANEVFYDIDTLYKECWEWTEFTPEKWKHLNEIPTFINVNIITNAEYSFTEFEKSVDK